MAGSGRDIDELRSVMALIEDRLETAIAVLPPDPERVS
jgi:hypothetical protein